MTQKKPIDQLSEEERNDLFKKIADEHIDVANTHLSDYDIDFSSIGFLYGAARFNAFAVASVAKDREEFDASFDGALDHYTEMFRSMLSNNLDNHRSSFEEAPRYAHLVKNAKDKATEK